LRQERLRKITPIRFPYCTTVEKIEPKKSDAQNTTATTEEDVPTLIKKYEASIKYCPDDPLVHAKLAELYVETKQFDKARDQFRIAIEKDPRCFEGYFGLANFEFQQQQFENAKANYEKALQINPSDVTTHRQLGICCEILGHSKEAKKYFETAIKLSQENKPLYDEARLETAKGVELMQSERYEEALSFFKSATEKWPNLYEAHLHLAGTYLLLGKLQDSKEYYRRALAINPEDPRAYIGMGRAFFREEKPIQSLPYYGKAIHLNPKAGYVYNLLGTALFRIRQFDMALENYNKALELDPNDVDAQDGVAQVLLEQGKLTEATQWIEKYVPINSKNIIRYWRLISSLATAGQKEEAIKYAQKILDAAPNRSENHLLCGILFVRLEQWDRAAVHFDLYEKLCPDKLEARVQRLEMLAKLIATFLDRNPKNSFYNLDHFLKVLQITVSLEPDILTNDSTLGTVAKKVGLADDDQGMLYAGLALLMHKKGDYSKATSFLAKATDFCRNDASATERLLKWTQQMCPDLVTSSAVK